MKPEHEILFSPLVMPNLTLKNRFFMAPMGTFFSSIEQQTDYFVERAKNDVALIVTGATSVHPGGGFGELKLERDEDIKPFVPMVKSVQQAGAKFVCQLNHAGRYAPSHKIGMQPVAPSPIPSMLTQETPRELSTHEVDDLVIAFRDAAVRAQQAGFDGIEILANTGYLHSQFLSPVTNKRKDKYGGDILGRATFLLSVVSETRSSVGNGFNISLKIDYEDGLEGGFRIDDTLLIAPKIVEAGADRLHIWAGWHEAMRPMLTMAVPRGAFAKYAGIIKNAVNVPVATVGRINDPSVAAEILSKGQADLIGLARPLLCDPEFVRKTREGRSDEIRRCIACLFCMDQATNVFKKGKVNPVRCGWNQELGQEGKNLIKPAEKVKTIDVVGAGPAGMEFARVAALRNHNVRLYEEKSEIGGSLLAAQIPPYKGEIRNIIDYYTVELKRLNVDLHLNEEYSLSQVNDQNIDTLVLATGAGEWIPDIQGIGNKNVATAQDVLQQKVKTGDRVVVIGGGLIGLETAEFLADRGKAVIVVEMLKHIGKDIGRASRWAFLMRIVDKFKVLTLTKVIEVLPDRVVVLENNEKRNEIPTDSVVLAAGLKSRDDLQKEIENRTTVPVYSIGSGRSPGLIETAFREAFELGCKI